MKKLIILISFLFLILSALFAQSPGEKDTAISSIREDRKAVLRFGIDSEVIEVIGKLIDEKDEDLQREVLDLLQASLNTDLQEKALHYFTELALTIGEDEAIAILANFEDRPARLVGAAIKYVHAVKSLNALEYIKNIVSEENSVLTPSAIKALGMSENVLDHDFLIEKLTDENFGARFKTDIILALGDMKAENSVDALIAIAENENEDATWRRYACDSLGKIGDPKALPTLMNLYRDPDAMTRLYALGAIGRFDTPEIEEILVQALKDGFWRIRIAAAESLGKMKAVSSLEILTYKAERDPEVKVREASLQALGEISTSESLAILKGFAGDTKKSAALRYESARILIIRDVEAALGVVMMLIDEEWTKKDSKLLDTLCKNLSAAESQKLRDVFVRFLDHPSMNIQIYGVLGIERNRFTDLVETLEEKKGKAHATVVRYINDALEKLR